MTAASFDAAYRAVLEACTVVTGRPRCLGDSDLFRSIVALDPRTIEAACKERKRAFVTLGRVLSLDPTYELSDRKRYAVTVRIERYYWAGEQVFSAEFESAMLAALNDTHRLRDALCWPSAHVYDSAGSETGLDGGALDGRTHTAEGPDRVGETKLIRMIDTYRATLELAAQNES
jgi:hypothetical protein